MELEITSLQNPRVKSVSRLYQRSERSATGHVVIEGYHELSLALAAGANPISLYYCPEILLDHEAPLMETCRRLGAELLSVSKAVMVKMSYREHPDAWLAVLDAPDTSLVAFERKILPSPSSLFVMAEGVEKPGNIGAILRSVDAAGAHGFIQVSGRTDLGNPNILRSSKASVYSIPCVDFDQQNALAWLRSRGIRILAASPAARSSYWQVDMRGPTVIAVGTEKEGLSDFWLDNADEGVKIPMVGMVNSLNVAQAATLMLYEAVRQRTNHAPIVR